MTTSLEGKIAVVTGASQGIGADIARALATAGAKRVIIVGLGRAEVDAVAKKIGAQAIALEADITSDHEIDRCVASAAQETGHIDILVNCACIYDDSGLSSTREQWHRTLGVNLISAAIFTQKVEPFMQPGSVIINLGSVGGKFGTAGRALYPASKAAMIQITKNFAVTLAPRGIRVLSVSPAWTWSPSLERLANSSRQRADQVGQALHPLGRVGNGEEVGRVVAFAVSEQASWMTGSDLAVDGGYSVLGPDQGMSAKGWFDRQ